MLGCKFVCVPLAEGSRKMSGDVFVACKPSDISEFADDLLLPRKLRGYARYSLDEAQVGFARPVPARETSNPANQSPTNRHSSSNRPPTGGLARRYCTQKRLGHIAQL